MDRLQTSRIVIVGAGLGALYAALNLSPRPVLVLSPDALGQGASSAWAQGGVAAAMDPADSPDNHARDTVQAGAGTVATDVAQRVTSAAQDHIHALTNLGAPFDRDASGGYVLSREAAHSFARVVRVNGDQAGAAIMQTLIAKVRATPSIQVLEGVLAAELLGDGARITGVQIQRANGTGVAEIKAPAVLLAGGGSAGLFAMTTNPPRIRGQVIGMAARAGAVIADAEFVQFHPTALDVGEDPAPLATEALRGEGAHLINDEGERFMASLHPDAELAPRDVVARAVYAQWQLGKRPMLDARAIFAGDGPSRFPVVEEACKRNGIDPANQPIPVAAAAHYHMGGVATDGDGKASLAGLWVCGEAASTGLHGANRLASNGLLEALVYAGICAQDIAQTVPEAGAAGPVVPEFTPSQPVDEDAAIATLRNLLTQYAGVIRSGQGLRRALTQIDALDGPNVSAPMRAMLATATLIVAAALMREESRGAHFRSDCPDLNPDTATRSKLTLTQAMALRSQVSKESLT